MSGRKCGLTTSELARLNLACIPVREALGALGGTYLVGSAGSSDTVRGEDGTFRDVDIRSILSDEEFDALFSTRPLLWSVLCWSVSEMVSKSSGFRVDFQIQKRSEANRLFPGMYRNPIGMKGRLFAGGGDASGTMSAEKQETE